MEKILIVEDVRVEQRVIAEILSTSGYDVIIADDGCQGFQFALEYKPSVIILDLGLPAGDGLTVLKRMRSSVHTRYIPVIILTGIQNQEYKLKVLNEGVDAFLEKPCSQSVLLSTIQDVLQKSKGAM